MIKAATSAKAVILFARLLVMYILYLLFRVDSDVVQGLGPDKSVVLPVDTHVVIEYWRWSTYQGVKFKQNNDRGTATAAKSLQICEYFRLPNALPESVVRRGADAREVMECVESITEAGYVVVNYSRKTHGNEGPVTLKQDPGQVKRASDYAQEVLSSRFRIIREASNPKTFWGK